MNARVVAVTVGLAAMLLAVGGAAQAAITIDTVPVGNPGNAGELSGAGAGGYGPDRICGAVSYTYNIGKYEVTGGQYTAFLNAVAATDTYALYNMEMSRTDYGSGITQNGLSGSYAYSVASDFANRPVNYVSFGDAMRFTNWLHNGQPTGAQGLTTTEDGAYYLNGATSDAALMAVNREADWKWAVTSEDEWYKAAYYNPATGSYYDYPTGSNTAPGQDMADASGNNANYITAPYAYPIDSGKYTTIAGEFQSSDSPYGTFDQGGNVFEWTEVILYDSYRGLPGGSLDCVRSDYLLASERWFCSYPTDEERTFGFRVVQLPEPGSAILLLAGALALFRRQAAKLPEGQAGMNADG